MARDGLLPPAFSAVHAKFQTPHLATLVTGTLAAIIGGLFPIGILGELVSIGTLIAFIVVCLGVLVLRYTRPDLERPFRVPAVWVTSLLGVVFCGIMAAFLPRDTWIRLLVWTAVGVVIYFAYGFRKSALNTGQDEEE
jgi:APA family basic amino acid/polyamine antiporter